MLIRCGAKERPERDKVRKELRSGESYVASKDNVVIKKELIFEVNIVGYVFVFERKFQSIL